LYIFFNLLPLKFIKWQVKTLKRSEF